MKPKVFLEFVEFQSLVASVLPFTLGLLYVWYNYHAFNLLHSVLFFIVIELMHMAVNANDNTQDFVHAKDEKTFKQLTNVVGHYHISLRLAITVIVSLSAGAAIIGFGLLKLTWGSSSWIFLSMGIIGFLVGYFYAGGPLPISNTPFGELFSGVTMGYVIMLAAVYVNLAPAQQLSWSLAGNVLLASGLAVFAIGNLMLANNLCDYEEDKLNERRTIVVLLGQRIMLWAWNIGYALGYVCMIAAVLVGSLPKLTLLALLIVPVVIKNNRQFGAVMVKSKSFVLAVKNCILITISFALAMGIGIIFRL
ncbi:prenyltransferase [Furfurilactobacillus rossiae]|uniref:1,4-dihydroxy-2-naphthoate octaprenyltransferase n=1 Tax=Furfurilactobacillus rossiae DSM 15814 TaxID=1114972 RepID=A0A0R1RHU8_9LACO|nr:prenyltransferase [Furfurilactobacillus rossiae]KRL56415.1 1,4-dihydroxy-2-naphthoate octaprenyltransferase [Furfurilactobacillus rossiae DSM 15814]QFR67920.1 1,4-dihydroxy-2-naphthoate prenyltransferase [Furfurilactobacillus rossiae]QLE60907.1 prenyltransferase contains 14-dihydroxy-2-naphthoate octaprenyltransferase domain [Furfurilactobacillus rossiae]